VIKVLFIAMHRPNRSPSQRYRFEQYFSFLEENGIQCELSYLISEADDQVLYQPGHYFGKLRILLKSILTRWKDVRVTSEYDFVFIQREAFFLGTAYFEKKFSQKETKVIFDFDDAIWLADESSHQGLLGRLKKPRKTSAIIALADKVIAGNTYLADYALRFNENVLVIPTTIDTERYKPGDKTQDSSVIIGWSGSFSTIKHFEEIVPVLLEIKKKYQQKVRFKLIGDANYRHHELGITGIEWQADTEVKDLQEFDIGIMPLPDNDWTRGKCGAKGLQYMGLGIATIMSPVGVNTDIIEDGVNGFLAENTEDWLRKLEKLIEFPEFRKELGVAGRKTVVEEYSVEANKEKYLALFE
jgi:glycosyltransferase involved in cell wall biosynthesis